MIEIVTGQREIATQTGKAHQIDQVIDGWPPDAHGVEQANLRLKKAFTTDVSITGIGKNAWVGP